MEETRAVGATADAQGLWLELYPPLASWCRALVGDRELAQDLASEAFVRLLSRWGSVRNPRAFLYVVASNLARDHWRRQGTHRQLLTTLSHVSPSEVAPVEDPWLWDLVGRLPQRLRQPVLLHYYADLPVSDVARALHRPEGTIKRALSEGRALLQAGIEANQ